MQNPYLPEPRFEMCPVSFDRPRRPKQMLKAKRRVTMRRNGVASMHLLSHGDARAENRGATSDEVGCVVVVGNANVGVVCVSRSKSSGEMTADKRPRKHWRIARTICEPTT